MQTPTTRPFPRRIHVEPTNICNLDCHFCPYRIQTRRHGTMRMEVFERLVEQCRGHDVRLWLHYLGEPLLNRRLPDMIRCAKEAGIPQVGLSTNAHFLTPEWDDLLIDSGLDRLEISVDGLDVETYRLMRRSDDFDLVVTNARRFLDHKKARGAHDLVVSLQFMKTDFLVERLEEARAQWRPHLGPRDFLMSIEDITFLGTRGNARSATDRRPCTWLFEHCLVYWNGDVATCASDFDAKRVLGNIMESTLGDIWRSPAYERLRRLHLEGRYDEAGICAGCTDWIMADGHGYANILDDGER